MTGLGPAALPVEVASHPEVGVRNSQPEGIGRVAVLNGLVAWNNLGRNVVFADRRFRPTAVFAATSFPDDDELSQYDLDVHAIAELDGTGLVVVLNHLGRVRGFAVADLASPGPVGSVRPVLSTAFADDVERTVVVGDQLVGSRPGSAFGGGLLVSEPVRAGRRERPLDAEVAFDGWGRITALGVFGTGTERFVAMGGAGRAAVVPMEGRRLGRPRFEVDVPLRTAVLGWDGRLLWAAGSELGESAVDDYRWEDLRGGGWLAIDPRDGRPVLEGPFPSDVAWGNGGVPVVLAGGLLCAVGRTGRLYFVRPGTAGSVSTAPLAGSSLGIAHAAAAGGRILFGFNRGGYRLHAAVEPATASTS